MRTTLEDDGASVLRGFLAPLTVGALSGLVDAAFRAADASALATLPENRGSSDMSEVASWHLRNKGGIMFTVLDTFSLLNLSGSQALSALTAEIGSRLAGELGYTEARLWKERSWVRRLNGKGSLRIQWHTDADAAAAKMDGFRCLNLWTPLDSVGDDLPTVQYYPGSHRVMRELPNSTEWNRGRPDEWVRTHFPAAPAAPRLQPGDALLLDENVLHRTEPRDHGEALRRSYELRFLFQDHGLDPTQT
jgi:hypothetical protein